MLSFFIVNFFSYQETLSQTLTPEESQTISQDDILAKALGVPEHPGRIRAVGYGVTQKSVFGQQSQLHPSHNEWMQMKQSLAHLTQVVAQLTGGQGVPPFIPGQPSFMPMPGQPPFMPMPPGQPPFMPMPPGQSVPHMPVPGQSHPGVPYMPVPSQKGSCNPMDSVEIPEVVYYSCIH